jgi:hypothetical protein
MKFVFISRSFFTLLLCALTICAFAHDREAGILNNITVGLHLGSVHSATGYNDFNPGAYIKFQNNVTVGHYYNSNYRSSNYVG